MLGAVLLAPVLPRIQEAFAGTPGVEALTPIVLTAPALIIGLTAMSPAGSSTGWAASDCWSAP